MSKITSSHLERIAYVYVRQSTLYQVQHHKESQRLQIWVSQSCEIAGLAGH